MQLTAQHIHVALAVILAAVGALAWLIRLEARLNTLQVMFEQHVNDKNIKLHEIVVHLDRMEHKVDLIRMRCIAFHHNDAPSLTEPEPRGGGL